MKRAPRKKKRVRNPAQTRLKLLQATVDLVADKGSDALSLKAATRRAKLSRGVAYQHFRDRNHLLSESKRWILDRLADGVRELAAAPLEERVKYSARLVLNHPEAAKLLITDALAGRTFNAKHPLYKLVKKTLKASMASGAARKDIDMDVMIYITVGSHASLLMLGETHKGMDRNKLADRFATEWTHLLNSGMYARLPK